jgi:hypothetical protein
MEDEESQTPEMDKETPSKTAVSQRASVKPTNAVPLMITMIGIFCYLGVVLPSVFGSTSTLDLSSFDLLLMVGGAALVGLGTYFWFKEKARLLAEDEKKSLETA